MLAENAIAVRRRPGRPSLSNEELLDKALDLFLTQGFERTSIEGICAAAGMAKRTVYARYGDKESLFKAALQRAIAEWIVPIARLRAVERDDLEASLLAISRLLVANLMSPAGLRLLRLTNAESGRMPEIGAFNVRQGTQPTIDFLAELFARRAGLAADEALLAGQAFLNMVVGGPAMNAAWGVQVDADMVERQTLHGVRLFLHGMLAEGGQAIAQGHGEQVDQALAALEAARAHLLLAKGAPSS